MEKVKVSWHKRISVKKAFFISTFFYSLMIVFLSALEMALLSSWRYSIVAQYEQYFPTNISNYYAARLVDIPTGIDGLIYYNSDMLAVGMIIITAIVLIIANVYTIYHWKLQKPLAILSEASKNIAANNLDIEIAAPSADELGRLCISFEQMRSSLQETSRELWKSVEERRRLNAAFAHDLRTPLTVLKGYSEMLLEEAPRAQMSTDALLGTLETLNRQIVRLEEYLAGMNSVKSLFEVEPNQTKTDLPALGREIKAVAAMMWNGRLEFFWPAQPASVYLDSAIVIEIFENIMANAVRYAKNTIKVSGEIIDKQLYLTLSDDGPGFDDKSIAHATEPYYRAEGEDNEHFGLGLYICAILSQKCGGKMLLSSPNSGGAVVTAQIPLKNI